MGTLYFGGNSLVTGSSGTYKLPIPLGYRWILVYAYSVINSSATAGTRSIGIYRNPGGNFSSSLFDDVNQVLTNSFSTVSSAQSAQLAPFAGANPPTVQSYPDYEFTSGEILELQLTLLSGDTGRLLIAIKEVLDL